MHKIKDWIRYMYAKIEVRLGLDIWLNRELTFRFKLMNLISGHSALVTYLSVVMGELDDIPNEEWVKSHPYASWLSVETIKEYTAVLVNNHFRKSPVQMRSED